MKQVLLVLVFIFISTGAAADTESLRWAYSLDPDPEHHNRETNEIPIAESIQILSLDDTSNPYQGQYDEWDVWAFQNLSSQKLDVWNTDQQIYQSASTVRVDPNGYLIPDAVVRLKGKDMTIGDCVFEYNNDEEPVIFSALTHGKLPEALAALRSQARLNIRYADYPRVPFWLYEIYHPELTVFLPDNRVAIKLADQLVTWPDGPSYSKLKDVWYLFDMDGNLFDPSNPEIRVNDWTASDTSWQELFWDTWQAGSLSIVRRFIYTREDPNDSNSPVTHIYDYDGTELPVNDETMQLPVWWDTGYFQEFDLKTLRIIMQSQGGGAPEGYRSGQRLRWLPDS